MINKFFIIFITFLTVILTQSRVWAEVQNVAKFQKNFILGKLIFFEKESQNIFKDKMGTSGDQSIFRISGETNTPFNTKGPPGVGGEIYILGIGVVFIIYITTFLIIWNRLDAYIRFLEEEDLKTIDGNTSKKLFEQIYSHIEYTRDIKVSDNGAVSFVVFSF